MAIDGEINLFFLFFLSLPSNLGTGCLVPFIYSSTYAHGLPDQLIGELSKTACVARMD